MFFCDTRAASFALFVVDYILMFYQEDGGMVRDILFTESQLIIAAQTFGELSFFYSSSLKNLLPKFSFFFPHLSFLKTEKCLRNAFALSPFPDSLSQ